MNSWPIFIIVWFCIVLFVATGVLSFLDTAGLRKIPFPSRSRILFFALLVEVVGAGVTVFKHYVEQGNIPLFFTNSSEVLIEKVKEHPISEQHSIDVKGKNGAMLHIFCRDVKVGAQKIYVTLSGDEVAEQTFEVPIHTLHKFNFEGGVYRLRLDGVVDWKERADEAFISIVPLR